MKKLKWWLWIVGGWYLLLGSSGLIISFVKPELYASGLPSAYAGNESALTASLDMNFVVMLVFVVLAVMMFIASRDPASARFFIMAMVSMEFFAYAVVNVIWMLRGWENVLPYLILHLLFGITGFVFLQQTKTE